MRSRSLIPSLSLVLLLAVSVLLLPACVGQNTGSGNESTNASFDPAALQGVHPRLYFTASDIPALQTRMQQAPTGSSWEMIRRTAQEVSMLPPGVDAPDAEWAVIAGLRYPALYYALTQDAAAGARGRDRLLQVCSWPSWTITRSVQDGHLVNYDTGKIAIAVGEAYDWLYPLMSDEERSTVRQAILEKAVKPAYLDYRSGAYLADAGTNRAAQGWGGIGVAALAIMGDDPGNPGVVPYFSACEAVMQEYLDAFDREGGWPEGVGYQSYGLSDGSGALYYLEALKQVTGENLYGHPGLQKAIMFPLYLAPPDRKSGSDSFGDDSFDTLYGGGVLARFTSGYRDGYAQWYFRNIPHTNADIETFLWYDGSVPETPPEGLPRSRLFPDMGWAVLRTGWGTGDTMLAVRSGPVAGDHNRPEQNSFLLDALGERLVIEPGVSSLTYDDPHMEDWYWATVSQNTVLVNGNPQSQARGTTRGAKAGEVTDFFATDFYDRVVGSAAGAYQGKLVKYVRQVVFVRPDYFVVFDDLEAPNAVKFDTLLHALGTNSIAASGDAVTVTRNSVRLHDTVLFPAGFTSAIRAGRPVLFQGADQPTSYVQLTTASPSTTARFLQVLTPLPVTATPPPVTRVEGPNVIGARVQGPSGTDTLLFSTGTGTVSTESISMDGQACLVRKNGGSLSLYALHEGKELRSEGSSLILATTEMTAAVRMEESTTGVLRLPAPAEVRIRTIPPGRVRVDGIDHPFSYDPETGLLSLSLTQGEHRLDVEAPAA